MTRTGNILTELVPRFEKTRGEVPSGNKDKAATGERQAEKTAFGNLVKKADGKAETVQVPSGKVDRAAQPTPSAAETARASVASVQGDGAEGQSARVDARGSTQTIAAAPAGPDGDALEALVARHAARDVRPLERAAPTAPVAVQPDQGKGESQARTPASPSRVAPTVATPIDADTAPVQRQEPAPATVTGVSTVPDGDAGRGPESDSPKVVKGASLEAPSKVPTYDQAAAPVDDAQPVERDDSVQRAEPAAERQPRTTDARQAPEATFASGVRDDGEPIIEGQRPDNAVAARQAPAEPALRRPADVLPSTQATGARAAEGRAQAASLPGATTEAAGGTTSQAGTGVTNNAAAGAATVALPRVEAAASNMAPVATVAEPSNEAGANGAVASAPRAATLPAPALANGVSANGPSAFVPSATTGLALGPVIRSDAGSPQSRTERAPLGNGSQPAPRETVTVLATRGPEMNARLVQEAASAQRTLSAQAAQTARMADEPMAANAAEPELAPSNARVGTVRQEMPSVATPSPATGPTGVQGQLVQSLTAPDGLARAAQELRLLATQPGATHTPETLKVLHIQLQPRDLGDVAVRLALRGDKLELRVQTARQATANLLMSDQRLLVEALQQKSFDIDTVTVQLVEPDRNSGAQPATVSNTLQGRGGQNESFLSGSQGQASRQNNDAGREGGNAEAERRDQRPDQPDGTGQRRGIYL